MAYGLSIRSACKVCHLSGIDGEVTPDFPVNCSFLSYLSVKSKSRGMPGYYMLNILTDTITQTLQAPHGIKPTTRL